MQEVSERAWRLNARTIALAPPLQTASLISPRHPSLYIDALDQPALSSAFPFLFPFLPSCFRPPWRLSAAPPASAPAPPAWPPPPARPSSPRDSPWPPPPPPSPPSLLSRRAALALALPLAAAIAVVGVARPLPAAASSLSLKDSATASAVAAVATGAAKLGPLLDTVRGMPEKLSADDVGYLHRARAAMVTPLLGSMAKAAAGVGADAASMVVAQMRGHDLELVTEIRAGRGKGVARELEEMVESGADFAKAAAGWVAEHK